MKSSEQRIIPTYRETAVAPYFRDYVACLWQSFSHGQPRQTMILPDGCIDLIWQAGAEPFIAGPMTMPVAMTAPDGSSAVGIRFQPGVAAAVLGVSAAELRDLRVPLAELFPAARRHPSLDRAVAGSAALTLEFALEAVTVLLRRATPPNRFVISASQWFAHYPGQPAAAFVSSSGVSERQARRLFQDHVGYGAKTLQRILRMQRVLWLLSQPSPPKTLALLALASGYADQAHLTREMRTLAGQRPSSLAENNPQSAVADLFKTPLA